MRFNLRVIGVKALFISGSPRKRSNTDYLLEITRSVTGGDFIKLSDYNINPCVLLET